MEKKQITIKVDKENGIKYLNLSQKEVNYTVSLSDEGCSFLDQMGADIILDFDESDNLVGIELMGL